MRKKLVEEVGFAAVCQKLEVPARSAFMLGLCRLSLAGSAEAVFRGVGFSLPCFVVADRLRAPEAHSCSKWLISCSSGL